MGVVLVSLRDVPVKERMRAIREACKGWAGEPDRLVEAALWPSGRRYPIDERRYAETVSRWETP